MNEIRIAPATESDVPAILEMIRGLAEYEKLSHVIAATEGRLRETLFDARPAAEVLLAYLDGECEGFALFFQNYSTFLAQRGIHLEDIYVKPHARGKGLGLALLIRLAQIAEERGCGRIDWQVLDWNEPSIGFYTSIGAKPMKDWTLYRLTGDSIKELAARGNGSQ